MGTTECETKVSSLSLANQRKYGSMAAAQQGMVRIWASGFITPVDEPLYITNATVGHSDRVVELYNKYCDRKSVKLELDLLVEIVALASEFFTADTLIMDRQIQNPLFTGLWMDFLNDTHGYIIGGDRELSIETWKSLLAGQGIDTDATNMDINSSRGKLAIQPSLKVSGNLVTQWINRPGGINDMLCTMYVLFTN